MPIFITAIGSVSALGDTSSARLAYSNGTCALRRTKVGAFDGPLGAVDSASEARLSALVHESRDVAQLDRCVHLALLAARDALRTHADPCSPHARSSSIHPTAVFFGSSRGATNLLETAHRDFLINRRVPTRTSPSTTLGNLASNLVRHALGSPAPSAFDLSSACSSSLLALQLAVAWLKADMAQACLAGGSESALTPFTLAQLDALGLLNQRPSEIAPCRPLAFEPSNTLSLGEGACALLLETLEDTDPRRHHALAEIAGIGHALEHAPSPTGISLHGDALLRSMRAACAHVDHPPDAIVVHAPGTARGDRAELAAIRALFGDDPPALCSNKWQLGHTFGASGALSIDFALTLLNGVAPAVPAYASFLSTPRGPVRSVLVNATGFGGLAISVLLRAVGSVA
ncbi:MAG: beta-ketoacyl synthase N-terminal-like domain-containing protein [Myxococcota bacterium]